MKKLLIISSILILILYSNKTNESIIIPENSIRIRIVANSNNLDDQLLKLKVKENIESILYKNLENTYSINDARNKINNIIPLLEEKLNSTLKSNDFSINYGYNYFPEKELLGIEYKEGYYESIVINIGEAKGKNWWCVLFPPICMIEVEKNDTENIEYKSKVLEIIKAHS